MTVSNTRLPRSIVQNRSIRFKVFVEGVDLTPLYSSISGVSFRMNSPATMTLVLECPENDLLCTADDLKAIAQFRKGSSNTPGSVEFGNQVKDAFLHRFMSLQVFPDLLKTVSGGASTDVVYLYNYGLNSSVIPVGANIRVFVEFEGVWYHFFCGAIISPSFTESIDSRKYLSLQCWDALFFLSRAKLFSQSLGVLEPESYVALIKALTAYDTIGTKGLQSGGPALGSFQMVEPNFIQFNAPRRDFVGAVAFAVYGEINPKATDDDEKYGINPEDAGGATDTTGTIMGVRNLCTLKFRWGPDDPFIPNPPASAEYKVYRNRSASGLFNLDNMQIGVLGSSAEYIKTKLIALGWSDQILPFDFDLLGWEYLTDTIVCNDDLASLCALPRADAEELFNTNNSDYPEGYYTQEEIISIIGANTQSDGIFSASSGALKIIMPGSLSGTVYDLLRPDNIDVPSADFYKAQSRLDVFRIIISQKTDFLFFATPKGHIAVEFPMLDRVDEDCFGELNSVNEPWRSYTRSDWQGSYSDNVNYDQLASFARIFTQVGANDTEVVSGGQSFHQDNPFFNQVAVSLSLLSKVGLRTADNDPTQGLLPFTLEAAKLKAELILNRSNRMAYTGSMSLMFQYRNLLNRNIELWDVGRAGLVTGVNIGIVKDSAPTCSVNLNYIREWDGDFLPNGHRSYSVAFGEKLVNIGIDYSKFFIDDDGNIPKETDLAAPETVRVERTYSKVGPNYTKVSGSGGEENFSHDKWENLQTIVKKSVEKFHIAADFDYAALEALISSESTWNPGLLDHRTLTKGGPDRPGSGYGHTGQLETIDMVTKYPDKFGKYAVRTVAGGDTAERSQKIINMLQTEDQISIDVITAYIADILADIKSKEGKYAYEHATPPYEDGEAVPTDKNFNLLSQFGTAGTAILCYKCGAVRLKSGRQTMRGGNEFARKFNIWVGLYNHYRQT